MCVKVGKIVMISDNYHNIGSLRLLGLGLLPIPSVYVRPVQSLVATCSAPPSTTIYPKVDHL